MIVLISLEKLSVESRIKVFNLCKIVCKTDLLKTVLVIESRRRSYAMGLLKFPIVNFDNRKNSAKCLKNPAGRLAIKDRQDDI